MPESLPLLEPRLLERIQGLSLAARRVVEGALHGQHRSSMHGLSIEFAQHRAYAPGDEVKHLDWRVLAKNDRYVIKQYEQETNLRAVVVVDASRSMAFGPAMLKGVGEKADATAAAAADQQGKFSYARIMAAAVSYLMLQQGDSVGMVLTTDQIVRQASPRATPGHILSLCHLLESTEPAGSTDLTGVLGQLAARLKRRSLLLVVSDLLDDPQRVLEALGQLHHRGHEVIVFHVLDRRELEFDLGAAGHGVTVIRDLETGQEFDSEPHLIRELVRREVQAFLDTLDQGARRYGLHLVRCTTDQPVEQVLARYLRLREQTRGRLA